MIEPVFVFDSREKWFPVGVEESLAAFGYRYEGDAMMERITRTGGGGRVDRLDFPDTMKQPNLPPVGYHRVVPGGGLNWHQYWFFYLYNPWSVAGIGRHEGDWEFVQLGCADDQPILVTGSQHQAGGKREYWSCEFSKSEPGRPRFYVALGSHANYFAPGIQGGGTDRCDGKGDVWTETVWREFGAWSGWPGRWGNSTGEGKSPESPGRQGARWNAPHLFHSRARCD